MRRNSLPLDPVAAYPLFRLIQFCPSIPPGTWVLVTQLPFGSRRAYVAERYAS